MAEPHGKIQQTQFVGRRNKQKRIQGNTNGGSLSLGLVLDTGHRNLMPRLLRFTGSSWFAVSFSSQLACELQTHFRSSLLSLRPLLAYIKARGFTSRKSFCRSGSQTLFFGGREATTGNASAVRRLAVSLSIRRFWGEGERWKRNRERAEGPEGEKPFSSPPPPSPI